MPGSEALGLAWALGLRPAWGLGLGGAGVSYGWPSSWASSPDLARKVHGYCINLGLGILIFF